MKYLKKFNEDTSATGGNAGAITGGEVYNMPTTGGSTVGPNAIGNNVGSTNMNNTDVKEPNSKPEKRHKKKRHKKRQLEQQPNPDEKPVMNWDEYTKKKYK